MSAGSWIVLLVALNAITIGVAIAEISRRVQLAYWSGFDDGRVAGRKAAVREMQVEMDLLEWKRKTIEPPIVGMEISEYCGSLDEAIEMMRGLGTKRTFFPKELPR